MPQDIFHKTLAKIVWTGRIDTIVKPSSAVIADGQFTCRRKLRQRFRGTQAGRDFPTVPNSFNWQIPREHRHAWSVVEGGSPMKRIIGVSPSGRDWRCGQRFSSWAAHRLEHAGITGPSGTGKESLRQAVHARKSAGGRSAGAGQLHRGPGEPVCRPAFRLCQRGFLGGELRHPGLFPGRQQRDDLPGRKSASWASRSRVPVAPA